MPRLVSRMILGLSLGWLCSGCAAAAEPAATPTAAPTSDAVEPDPASTHARGFGPWQASLGADHPLIGTAWSVADGRALTRSKLEQRMIAARFVLLGETHDHPDHHRLQGEMIARLLEPEGPGPAVAYEMLDPSRQAEIDAFVAAGSADVDAFAERVAWAESGWPEWALYRPAFAPAIEAGLPILAAQFPRTETRRFMSEGLATLPPEMVARYGLDQPLPAELLGPQLDEMFSSHCEMVPREQLTPMVEIQRVRDALMADALLRGAEARGQAVLVAGTGHTRASGVPRLLELAGEDPATIISVGFIAADPSRLEPSDYGDDFEVIVLTPDIEREDPCEGMSMPD